ncbi:MAG: TMEM198/TM7SF3 family protein [Dorea sp.]|nr:TMEM198/TM7SF3 family protein [Dorea sp.]
MNQMITIGSKVLEQVISLQSTVQGKLGALPTGTTAMIGAIVIGLVIGLFGIKLIRLFTAVTGLGFGALLGIIISDHLAMASTTSVIVIIGCAVIMAFLASFFIRIGTFIMMFFLGLNICTYILNPDGKSMIPMLICFGAPLLIAIISAIIYEPVIIILTGIVGGVMTGVGVVTLGGKTDIWWMVFGMCAGFSVIGMMTQIIINGLSKGKSFKSRADKDDVAADTEDDTPSSIGDDTINIDLD